ncbi:MAG: hypothetical protein PUA47_02585 [Bacteroidales bacterium]|nr:hypothetical protein [Bacteroidales bacterium]
MKSYKHILLLTAVSASIFAACCKEEGSSDVPAARRTVKVCCPVTKTTIDYEGSDVSHLAWSSGDKLGYVTTVAGDRVQAASVNSNSFFAEIPAFSSEEDSIYVIYPLGENEGRLLSEIRLQLSNPAVQNVSLPFDGSCYPMYAKAAVPASSGNAAINVSFEFPAAILRFSLSAEESAEILNAQALEFSGSPYMTGEYSFGSSGSLVFTPSQENASQKIQFAANEEADLAVGPDGLYVYAVVPRTEISDFDVKVTTDVADFSFTGGSMDLRRKDRSLWRISLKLTSENGDKPAEPTVFKPVKSLDELNEEDSYIIVADADESSYYLAAPGTYPTASSGGTLGINTFRASHTDGNIELSDDLLPCILTLKKGNVEDNTFAIRFTPEKGANCWCCAPGAATFSVNNGFFFNPAPDTDSEEQGYWKFTYEEPYVKVTSRKVSTQHFYFIQDLTAFRPARDDASEDGHTVKYIKFLRLQ